MYQTSLDDQRYKTVQHKFSSTTHSWPVIFGVYGICIYAVHFLVAIIESTPSEVSHTHSPYKMMVGRLLSFWERQFSGANYQFSAGHILLTYRCASPRPIPLKRRVFGWILNGVSMWMPQRLGFGLWRLDIWSRRTRSFLQRYDI